MDLIRIGEKVINKSKISRMISKVLELRNQGMSQIDVAKELHLERTFISRLESLGEVHKGRRVALIGFPVGNKAEIQQLSLEMGVEFVYLMSEDERWVFLENNGLNIVNQIMDLMVHLKDFDLIIFLGSDMRIDLADTLLPGEVVGIELGVSPIKEDKFVDIEILRDVIAQFMHKERRLR